MPWYAPCAFRISDLSGHVFPSLGQCGGVSAWTDCAVWAVHIWFLVGFETCPHSWLLQPLDHYWLP